MTSLAEKAGYTSPLKGYAAPPALDSSFVFTFLYLLFVFRHIAVISSESVESAYEAMDQAAAKI